MSDQLEVGLRVSGSRATAAGMSGAVSAVAVAPFVKFLTVQEAAGFYVDAAPGLLSLSSGGNSTTILQIAVGLGGEFFVTESWSIALGPQYSFLSANGESIHALGISWGMSGYVL